MKPERTDELLKDILADAASPEFREEAFRKMVGAAHQRSRARRLGRTLACLAVAGLLSLWYVHETRLPRPSAPGAVQNVAISSVAEAEIMILRSRPVPPGMFIASSLSSVSLVQSRMDVAVVRSRVAGELFKTIGDEELFDSLEGRPAVLVRLGPESSELVLFNNGDGAQTR